MNKHTPGPWKISGSKPGFSIDAKADQVVWEMGGISRIEDALLMAAAPELLAACEALVEELSFRRDLDEQERVALQWGRDAIARAKGGVS